MKKYVRQLFALNSAYVFSVILSVLFSPFVVRFMGAGEYGKYSVFLSTATILFTATSFSARAITIRFVSRGYNVKNVFEKLLRIVSCFVGIVSLLVLTNRDFVEKTLNLTLPEGNILYSLFLYVFLYNFLDLARAAITGKDLLKIISVSTVVEKATLVYATLILFFETDANYISLVYATLFSIFISGTGLVNSLKKIIDKGKKVVRYKTLLSFGAVYYFIVIPISWIQQIDKLILRNYLSYETIGYYAAAQGLTLMAAGMMSNIGTLIAPKKGAQKLNSDVFGVLKKTVPYSLIFAIGLVMMGPFAYELLYDHITSDIVSVILILSTVVVSYAIYYSASPFVGICCGRKELFQIGVWNYLLSGLSYLGYIKFIPQSGIVGCATVYAAISFLRAGIYVWYAKGK